MAKIIPNILKTIILCVTIIVNVFKQVLYKIRQLSKKKLFKVTLTNFVYNVVGKHKKDKL